jgi:hypothetical protein
VTSDLVDLLRTALPAITALAGVALGEWLQSRRDTAIYRRAIAAAKAARMRGAFEPVIVAAMGLKSAAGEYFMSSGDPNVNAQQILDRALTTVNEARAQLMIEEDLSDVFQHLEDIWRAFDGIRYEIGGRIAGAAGAGTTADEMKDAFAMVNGGPAKLAQLMNAHLRRIER